MDPVEGPSYGPYEDPFWDPFWDPSWDLRGGLRGGLLVDQEDNQARVQTLLRILGWRLLTRRETGSQEARAPARGLYMPIGEFLRYHYQNARSRLGRSGRIS